MKPIVADIMNPKLLYLAEGSRADLAREPILKLGVTAVPVLDPEGRPVGVVSLRDLASGKGAVEPTAPAFTIVSTASVEAAARAIAETDYRHLVVVDEKTGRAVGMLSAMDVIRAMLDMPPRHPAPSAALADAPPKG